MGTAPGFKGGAALSLILIMPSLVSAVLSDCYGAVETRPRWADVWQAQSLSPTRRMVSRRCANCSVKVAITLIDCVDHNQFGILSPPNLVFRLFAFL
jgi:hypothetical protein